MKTHTVVFTSEEVNVILRGLTFALDMGEDTYFAFYPGQGGYPKRMSDHEGSHSPLRS